MKAPYPGIKYKEEVTDTDEHTSVLLDTMKEDMHFM
jgi:hypothetical protein